MMWLTLVINPKPMVYLVAECGFVGLDTMQSFNKNNGSYAASRLPTKFARLSFTNGQQSRAIDNEFEISGPMAVQLLMLHCCYREKVDQTVDAEAALRHYLEGPSLNCAINYLCEVVPRIAEPTYDEKFDKPRGSMTAYSIHNELTTRREFWNAAIAPDATVSVVKKQVTADLHKSVSI